MPDPLEEESLFAAIGLDSILEGKPTPHKYKLQDAADFPRAIRRRVLAFLADDSFRDAVDMPAFDYQKTLREVSAPLSAEASHALMEKVPDVELATDLGVRANSILTWARPLIPRETTDPIYGATPMEPDKASQADFRRVWNVARDPLTVLDDLEDGSLGPDQVGALALLYPALYAEVRGGIIEGMASMRARRGKTWEPAPAKAQLLGTLMQQDTTDVELATAVQQSYAQEAQQANAPKPKTPSAGNEDATEGTPGQKASSGESATG